MGKRLSLVKQSFQLAQQENVTFLLHSVLVVGILLLTFIPPFAFGNQLEFMKEQALSITFFVLVFDVIFLVNALVQKERVAGLYWFLQAHGVSALTYTFSRFFGIVLSFIPLLVSAGFAVSLSLSAIADSELHLRSTPLIVGLIAILAAHGVAFVLQYVMDIRYGLSVSYLLPIFLGVASLSVGLLNEETFLAVRSLLFLGLGFVVYTAMLMMLARFFAQTIVMLLSIVLLILGIIAPFLGDVSEVLSPCIVGFQRYYAVESTGFILILFSGLQVTLFLFASAVEERR